MNKLTEKILDWLDILFGEKGDSPKSDLEKYKRKIRRHRQVRIALAVLIVVLVLGAVLLMKRLIEKRTYDGYRVVEISEQVDSSILKYQELGNYVLKYSGDGVSLLGASDEVLWNDSIQMNAPVVESFHETAAVYEVGGTSVYLYNEEGRIGVIHTDYPILKVSVSAKGGAAMLLEKEGGILMNYYSYNGELISSSTSNMRSPGYPMDLSLSEDGMSLAVVYFVAEGEGVSSYLAFYNFGEEGKEKEDNLTDGFRFDRLLVPEIRYIDDKTAVAYREDGFTLYRGKGLMEKVEEVTFEKEIISCFQGGGLFGFVFSSSDQEHVFDMQVYDSSGKLQMRTGFDVLYDKVKISGSEIVLYNANELAVIGRKGDVRFKGNFEEGSILDVVKRGMNRYAVACDKGVVTIVLD